MGTYSEACKPGPALGRGPSTFAGLEGSRARGLQQLWCRDLAAPKHMESSWTRPGRVLGGVQQRGGELGRLDDHGRALRVVDGQGHHFRLHVAGVKRGALDFSHGSGCPISGSASPRESAKG